MAGMMCGGIATSRIPASDLGCGDLEGVLRAVSIAVLFDADRGAPDADHFGAQVDVAAA